MVKTNTGTRTARSRGFTLVELLIVIVVVAILAALSVVAYNGIVDRAHRASAAARLSSLIQAVQLYNTDNGVYPSSVGQIEGTEGGDGYSISGTVFCVSVTVADKAYHRFSDSADVLDGDCLGGTEAPLALAVAPESCFAFDNVEKNIMGYYTHENDNASNPACPENFATPTQIGGVDVLGIGYSAFQSDIYAKQIVISDGVQSILNAAFYDSALTYIYVPNTVTSVKSDAFNRTKVESLTIPSSVTDFGCGAIYQAPNLTTLKLFADADGSTPPITFQCSEVTSNPQLSSLTLGQNVVEIGGSAFSNNPALVNLTIADGSRGLVVTGGAFGGASSLQAVTLPSRTTELASGAFSGDSQLASFTVLGGGSAPFRVTSSPFGGTALQSVSLPSNTTLLAGGAFSGISTLTSAVIATGGSSPLTITDAAFMGAALQSFVVPSHTAVIDSGAFSGNIGLTSLTIDGTGSTSLSISGGAFTTVGITSVHIPARVTVIDSWAFSDSPYLSNVTFENGVQTIAADAFTDTAVTSVSIPTATTVDPNAFPPGTTITRF